MEWWVARREGSSEKKKEKWNKETERITHLTFFSSCYPPKE